MYLEFQEGDFSQCKDGAKIIFQELHPWPTFHVAGSLPTVPLCFLNGTGNWIALSKDAETTVEQGGANRSKKAPTTVGDQSEQRS